MLKPHQEFPENRPRDQHGVPIPTEQEIVEKQGQTERVAREKIEIEGKPGVYIGPVAGHDQEHDRDEGR